MKMYDEYDLAENMAVLFGCVMFLTAYYFVDTSGDPNLIRYLVSVLIEAALS